jgi:hypothetical protein
MNNERTGVFVLKQVSMPEVREQVIHSVAYTLENDTEKFLKFAHVAIHNIPWKIVKNEYARFLPESLFALEGMFPDEREIIPSVQSVLQDLGCQRMMNRGLYTKYGRRDVMFGKVFSPDETIAEANMTDVGFPIEKLPATHKLYNIARLFKIIDTWPDTRHCSDLEKLDIVTKMVNTMATF